MFELILVFKMNGSIIISFIYMIASFVVSSKRILKDEDKHSSVLDLLKSLPHSSKIEIIKEAGVKAWKFHGEHSGDITLINLHKILHKKTRAFTAEFIGFSAKRTIITLFGIYIKHKPLPLLELSLDVFKRTIILRYQGDKSFQRVTLTFGKEVENWNILTTSVNITHFTAKIGCTHTRNAKLLQKFRGIPKGAYGVLGSGKTGENKLSGVLVKAHLYGTAVTNDRLSCSQPASIILGEDDYFNDISDNGNRLLMLEQQILQLNKLIDTLKAQNVDLMERITELEAANCHADCALERPGFNNGDTWKPDLCTICINKSGKPECLRRTDIPACYTPCQSNPCLNYGQCVSFNSSIQDDIQCLCQPPYDGQFCENKENPCVWPQESGICDQNLLRYYYDVELQECLSFNYTGCGGNINNYESLEECQVVAVIGACCYREISLRVENYTVSVQQKRFGCKNVTLPECQSTHRKMVGNSELEVIAFYPGVSCLEAKCGHTEAICLIGDHKYEVGERAVLGCQECTCESSGQFSCSCSKKAVRKEIRDMTPQELAQFQAAIQQLRLVGPGNPWEEFRDIYMRHSMHSNGGPYFLPWHRMFLRKLEQRLQQIDCSITLPYFDFTTDVGNFQDAIIWQPNYFGGNGINGCVPDHPFGLPGAWRPCISRNFNQSVQLPTLVELSLALASPHYMEMSMCLESFVSYIHTYIGGDMATRAAPYDPIFYSIHAYIDMLYWWWQSKENNINKYPTNFYDITMVPFNLPPRDVIDLENGLCVTYRWPSTGHPCNRSLEDNIRNGSQRGDITPAGQGTSIGEFNSLGYNSNGYDRRRFDKYGYRETGYNRDGFNKDGYDIDGYNRYGYNRDGYNRFGYNIKGLSKDNVSQDQTGRYNVHGMDMNCLDRQGFTSTGYDKYGFNKIGFDGQKCNYLFNGPFDTIQSHHIWKILLLQPKSFLMMLTRTCPRLEPLPMNWLHQHWITDIKDVSDMIHVSSSKTSERNSDRFCFDIDDFVNTCVCTDDIAVCATNPCMTSSCPSYPEAICRIDFCGECRAVWFRNGQEMDCFEKRDFCLPNPCENGGTCVQSIWPSWPQQTTCECPPGFDGHYCQYPALDICELPMSTGNCSGQYYRWYFDYTTQTCKNFTYTGCKGNSNNFETKPSCESMCRMGACYYRYPKNRQAVIGYDIKGYDMYGFNVGGTNRRGDVRVEANGFKTGRARFDSLRYDWQGFDQNGYDSQGFDRLGLDKSGFDRNGFNLLGYNHRGEFDGNIDYNISGYDAEGFNRAGYNCQGVNRDGFNVFGVYSEYIYKCRSSTLQQCQKLELEPGYQVVKFIQGKKCEEEKSSDNCGCEYNNRSFRYGESFKAGCQHCTCTYTRAIECSCLEISQRKEIRDLTILELQAYQEAIKKLNYIGYPSKWFNFSDMYAHHKPQATGSSVSLPWNRYFLRLIEQTLQEIDCNITIPYYDWTLNAGDQEKSRIWSANKFGGNGAATSGCVDYHPFKYYYPPYWIPCLRRQFNTSLPLPDTIDIHIALKEPTYENFRIHMEVYLNMFKAWVGGQMNTDHSAYDPLFLSVLAFVDGLWWDWQNKHPNSLLQYPQERRYVPMMPFQSSPDDVMDSKKQMCVSYIPISEAALCNITLPELNYNLQKYNRHGFDKEGYNIDGYDVFGVNRNGQVDDRGIYNAFGYDAQGYKRNGYDSSGFDRYGFSVDDFNVDGFDSSGFDHRGYDRYGFDRTGKTPFGFYRNITMTVNTLPGTFDSYGFNRYGLNPFGLDRHGYDIFGFDTLGYNRSLCNRYFLGPMLIIIKRWADLEIEKADNNTIWIITRICPPLNSLPEWMYTNNWLKRGSQVPLIEGLLGRAQQRASSRIPQVYNSSLTSETVWLPVAPDQSLCFVTYYYTECPFGVAPVECSQDLCQDRRCPGFPNAVCYTNRCGGCKHEWYNGVTGAVIQCSGCVSPIGIAEEGVSWKPSDCKTCSCLSGLVTCVETTCPLAGCTHPVKVPGQCCLQCQECDFNGSRVRNGMEFSSPSDKCQICFCNHGNVTCRYMTCPDLGTCSSKKILDGECCPTCLDCGNRENGQTWMDTPCLRCTCLNGRIDCEKILCIPPDCSHPHIGRGECCASCEGCFINGQDLSNGQTYMPDQCTECMCTFGNVDCGPLPCPIASCSRPITPQGECCPRCDNECQSGGRRFRHNQTFESQDDHCKMCTCDNSVVRCRPVPCQGIKLDCRRPITIPGDCCPSICPTCSAEGKEYRNGERWTSISNPCETCVCEEGILLCNIQQQGECPSQCDHGVVQSGECCSKCTECNFFGLVVGDGQTFVHPGDNCQQCMCRRGQISCRSLGPCPQLQCRRTVTPPGACCAQCVACDYQGNRYTHGIVVSQDDCSKCLCLDGEVKCDRMSCPEALCHSPVKIPGQCCPVCQECRYKGQTYKDGQRFTPLREPCLDCLCSAGKVQCSSRESECPISKCTHPFKSLQHCCPKCDGCMYLRHQFKNGQKFIPPGNDNCKVCRCLHGSVHCNTTSCAPVNCNNAVLVKGQCCPVCPMGCNVMGIEYSDGQTFIDFMDRCKVCTCMMGEITCMAMMSCTPVTCTHPANRPGNCCPSCTMCEMNNLQYRNGEKFPNPRNPCEECTCLNGSITCRRKSFSCPQVNCLDPILDFGTCCPVCENKKCTYLGQQYQEGQPVLASQDPCVVCHCSKGFVDCIKKKCPAVRCLHPGKDACCDTCEFCEFNGRRFKLEETFPSPQGFCEDCVCKAGSIQCTRRLCSVAKCESPTYLPGECCPVCSDCTYQGQLYKDGTGFRNPSKLCERCHCMKGNVTCDSRLCPKGICQSPVAINCCRYNNNQYRDGEVFVDSTGCNQCTCINGTVQCRAQVCPDLSCGHPLKVGCCLECEDCFYQNREIGNGKTFQDIVNSCILCTCNHGNVSCDQSQCHVRNCSDAFQEQCSNCNYYGQEVRNGSVVSSILDACEECQCIRGNIHCYEKICTKPQCTHPVKTGCCPVCDGCSFSGTTFQNNSQFSNNETSCLHCTCTSGNVTCINNCSTLTECFHDDKTYKEGEKFNDSSNPCNECRCLANKVVCSKQLCPQTSCLHPIDDGCCLKCDGCNYDSKDYSNGQTFQKGCEDCTCSTGTVTCVPRTCPLMTCELPIIIDCCQVCHICNYKDHVLKEGEVVQSRDDPCSQCVCQLGTIKCKKKSCDIVTCSNPVLDECGCPVCSQGCRYQNVTVDNGETFQEPANKCRACLCMEGNVRCDTKTCQSSCTHPADSDGCCPLCNSCLYQGVIQTEHSTFTSITDPCLTCTCLHGSVACSKIQCPKVTCDNPVAAPGQCCAECTGCIDGFTGRYYQDKQTWKHPDNGCISCYCKARTMYCDVQSCPPLRCSIDQSIVTIPGLCCPVCEKIQDSECFHNGVPQEDGHGWQVDECTSCMCSRGKISCTYLTCYALDCGLDGVATLLPTECCPVCVPKPGICTLYGGTHYHTFDRETIHARGTCRYIMASDCDQQTFSVEIQMDDRKLENIPGAQNITVNIYSVKMDFLQNSIVVVNGIMVDLPYNLISDISIEKHEQYILLNTQIGVKLLWDGSSFAELTIPAIYKNKTCGLCGNFNGFAHDDMTTKSGEVTNSTAFFVNSWKVPHQKSKRRLCKDAADRSPCDTVGYRTKQQVTALCEVLRGEMFKPCHGNVRPDSYISSCVYDLCTCVNKSACLCDILTTYARECANTGVQLQWRSHTSCAIECESDNGFVYNDCAPVCVRSCYSWQSPLSRNCHKPCVSQCKCPADEVVHDGKCISIKDCPVSMRNP